MEAKQWLASGKVALFWGLYLGVIFAAGKLQPLVPSRFGPLLWGATSVPAVFLLNYFFARREGKTLGDLWISFRRRDGAYLLLGLGIGLSILPMTIALCSVVAGPIEVRLGSSSNASTILMALVSTALLVVMEELGFRAYSLSTLVVALGKWRGQILAACAFAACHFLFGWSTQSILTGVLPSGLLFGAAAYATRSVSAPIGLHLGMNLAQWAIRANGGIVTLVLDDNMKAPVQTAAMFINIGLVVCWCWVFWWKGGRSKIVVGA